VHLGYGVEIVSYLAEGRIFLLILGFKRTIDDLIFDFWHILLWNFFWL